MKRQSKLIPCLEKLELEDNSPVDDGQLTQSLTPLRDDIRRNLQSLKRQLELQPLTPVSKKSVENDMTIRTLQAMSPLHCPQYQQNQSFFRIHKSPLSVPPQPPKI